MATLEGRAVSAALHLLGDSPDTVAHRLSRRGCEGDSSASGCPVARYLNAEFPDFAWQVLTYSAIAWNDGDGPTIFDNPTAVSVFVSRFDRGDYPMLRES